MAPKDEFKPATSAVQHPKQRSSGWYIEGSLTRLRGEWVTVIHPLVLGVRHHSHGHLHCTQGAASSSLLPAPHRAQHVTLNKTGGKAKDEARAKAAEKKAAKGGGGGGLAAMKAKN
ncbi:MAG: hypothetical protein WDW38_000030 [Sanguina aurantia]